MNNEFSDEFQSICQTLGLSIPIKEYKFHPERRWRIDYAWPSFKIAVEIEGALWIKGRHVHPSGFIKDMEKYNALSELGWNLYRYEFSKNYKKVDWQQIERALKNKSH